MDVILKMAVNDISEISFGTMTGQLQYYGKIGLTNDENVSQLRVNRKLLRGFDTVCKNKNTKQVEGIFHELSKEMRV